MRRVANIMGMPVTIDVGEVRAVSEIIDQAYAEFRRMDELLSPFKATSQVCLINAGVLTVEEADPLVRLAADLSTRYEQATGGYFSAWVRGRFDPSGVVKALAIDRACSILDAYGCTDYLVDAGGDCRVRGNSESGRPWRVGIRHPVERDKVVCVLSVVDAAVATSGTYEKGDHIIDPLTGEAARELLSMTVVGPDIVDADVYATTAFAMGSIRGLDFVERHDRYEAFAINRELTGSWTTGFQSLRAS